MVDTQQQPQEQLQQQQPPTPPAAAEVAAAPDHPQQSRQHQQQRAAEVTLDAAREHFYVAHRACERFSQQLGAVVARLQAAQEGDAWLTEVQAEAHKAATFHQQQAGGWAGLAGAVDGYVDSVRELAERMAVADLKGETPEEPELPENRARTIHPELQRFQLEKKARILGKIGGVPALGPSAGALPLPAAAAAAAAGKGQILKATASAAAREIYYSKMEDKDAAQLAGVFQFRKTASTDADAPAQWQQEARAKNVRRQSEAAADEVRRLQEQEEQLVKGGAVELAGVLKSRQQALKGQEEDEAASAASSYRRVSASGTTANAPLPVRELQEATPELAAKLKQRQDAAAASAQQQAADDAAAAPGAAQGSSSSSGADAPSSKAPGPQGAAFGGELAAVLCKRRESDEAKAAAAPVKAATSAPPPAQQGVPATADSELAQRLRARASKLAQDQAQQEDQQAGP